MCCCDFVMFVIGIFILCIFMLLCGYFLGGRSIKYFKCVPFESGIESVGSSKIRFSVRFYLISMLFVIFDVEGVYLYIWSVSIRESSWLGFIEALIFIFIMLISLLYLVRIGVFDWVQNNNLNKYK